MAPTPLPPMPIQRYLVPDERPVAPDGFTLVDEKITEGLPHTIRLDSETVVLVLVPTGLATAWRDADPAVLVASSESGLAPAAAPGEAGGEPVGNVARPPARLLVRRTQATAASLPLVFAGTRPAPDAGDPDQGVQLQIVPLAWDIRAGSLRGPGDFGSRIAFAWRFASAGAARFGPLPINPHVLARLQKQPPAPDVTPGRRDRIRYIESTLGLSHTATRKLFQVNTAGQINATRSRVRQR